MSEVLGEKACSARQIVELATKHHLKIQGLYHCLGPNTRSLSLVIDADQPVNLKDLLAEGTAFIFNSNSVSSKLKALGWYGDEIHIFSSGGWASQEWKFITFLGSREDNVATIEKFILKRWANLRIYKANLVRAVKFVYSNPSAHGKTAEQLMEQMRGIMNEADDSMVAGVNMVSVMGELHCNPMHV
ncbi:putative effector protein [Blumeria hordei DH14]|uniref:Putative effector protein n=1 Tax=Blumeria graminis f. sp. hordei (strain DH14) TaxID=546991 RepID=N1JJT0_BLUG1|nr:putative effector protein [Blumeria hordei DH14]